MMRMLTELLLAISNALLIPDILLLLYFFAMAIAYMGGMVAEAIARLKYGMALQKFVKELRALPHRKIRMEDVPAATGLAAKAFLRKTIDREKLMDDLQLESERLLARLMLGIRLGPMLGLAGTLIPLGPALVALSSGDLATFSTNLVVAFTTTVLGLFIGGLFFTMHSFRRQWYMQDLNDIEFVMKRMEASDEKNPTHG